MGYVLHNRLGSGGFAVEAALTLAGAPFETRLITSRPSGPLGSAVAHLNRWGQLPVLEMGDGTKMTEVAAILAYLERVEVGCRQGPHLFMDDEASSLRWLVFLSVNVYEGILRQAYPERYIAPLPQEPKAASRPPQGESGDRRAELERALALKAKERVHAAFRTIQAETEHHSFTLSDRLSCCDIYLAMLYEWHGTHADLPKCTAIARHVATHPKIAPLWEQNFQQGINDGWRTTS
ncbi:MAG: glutathione S-transferase [Pseudomonadota bacterium]